MGEIEHDRRIIQKDITLDVTIREWATAFIRDRQAQNLAKGTISFYELKLKEFINFTDNQVINTVKEITANTIRDYLMWLKERHNAGGVHAFYRATKAFLIWYEKETEPADWHNPIKKVKAPRVALEPLEPIKPEILSALLTVCNQKEFTGARDYAAFLFLFDTGCRAAEVCALDLIDYDQVTGEVLIRQGKGKKPRIVFVGRDTRRAIRRYLKVRDGLSMNGAALWLGKYGDRLTYDGLRQALHRRADDAGISRVTLHSFRRGFALSMLRAGVDVYSLQALMGHSDLSVLKRYLKQNSDDLRAAHEKGSPVDNLL